MGGQVLGGGVVVLVAVALWLVYLLPSIRSRHQHSSSERNAVRLNQALRVLAETSETPEEVRVELTARTVHAQQKVARRAQEERESIARRIQEEKERAELVKARDELTALRADPLRRRARARRITRLLATLVTLAGIAVTVWGGVALIATGTVMLMIGGIVAALSGVVVLSRLARVGARSASRSRTAPAVRSAPVVQDVPLPSVPRNWTPRELPRPLVSSTGSRAAAAMDAVAARDALRQAAVDEAIRERAEQEQPPSIEVARTAAQDDRFAQMGYVDDAEIEANVRRLLQRRAVGQ